jgi:hypothetical protein
MSERGHHLPIKVLSSLALVEQALKAVESLAKEDKVQSRYTLQEPWQDIGAGNNNVGD